MLGAARGALRSALSPGLDARRLPVLCLVGLCALLLMGELADAAAWVPRPALTAGAENPFANVRLYAASDSRAAQAAAVATGPERAAFERLASTPTAVWLTPERYPAREVDAYVTARLREAAEAGALATFVVYGIPWRDAGGASGGSTRPDEYLAWIGQIARAIRRHGTLCALIVEPDALALSAADERLAASRPALAAAVAELASSGAAVYVDAGHCDWVSAEKMAALLEEVGVDGVRGFSLNVSSYYPDAETRAYGERLAELTGARYVVDTSRNGAGFGRDARGTWENPRGTRVGRSPAGAGENSGHLDAWLWVKPPGESDGPANGGPPAGEWWPEKAMELVR